MKIGRLCGKSVERVARGDELQRPRLGKAHRRRDRTCAIESHEGVTEFARSAGSASVNAPIDHDSAADAGTDRDHDEVVRDEPQLVVMRLGERGDSRIVIDEGG